MSPADYLGRAIESNDQTIDEVNAAIEEAEPWVVDSMRFLKAELLVSKRRLENIRKVLTTSVRRTG